MFRFNKYHAKADIIAFDTFSKFNARLSSRIKNLPLIENHFKDNMKQYPDSFITPSFTTDTADYIYYVGAKGVSEAPYDYMTNKISFGDDVDGHLFSVEVKQFGHFYEALGGTAVDPTDPFDNYDISNMHSVYNEGYDFFKYVCPFNMGIFKASVRKHPNKEHEYCYYVEGLEPALRLIPDTVRMIHVQKQATPIPSPNYLFTGNAEYQIPYNQHQHY